MCFIFHLFINCFRYIIKEDKCTGVSVALINGPYRSLVAYIGAAGEMTVENIKTVTKNCDLLDTVQVFYMEGFFLPKRNETAKYILNVCKQKQKLFCFNLSAPYVCDTQGELVKYLVEQCDILIGNKKEYTALMPIFNNTLNLKEFAVSLSKLNENTGWKRGKIILVTNGSKSIICAHSSGTVEEMNVPRIDPNLIKDTTGAGDAFAAGFLAGVVSEQTINMCLAWGCVAAREIIKEVGCKIPEHPPNMSDLEILSRT